MSIQQARLAKNSEFYSLFYYLIISNTMETTFDEKLILKSDVFKDYTDQEIALRKFQYAKEETTIDSNNDAIDLSEEEAQELVDELDYTRKLIYDGDYLVLDDEEADEEWERQLENYLEECIYPELPDNMQNYFDDNAWKRDAKMD